MTRVLIEKTKHYDNYWDISTDEKWAAAALLILKQRIDDGYIYKPDEPTTQWSFTDEERQYLAMPQDVVDELPDVVKTPVLRARARWNQKQRDYVTQLAEYQQVQKLVDEMDMTVEHTARGRFTSDAWRILESRSDYEYEQLEVEELTDPMAQLQRV